MQGTIVVWNAPRAFGFIRPDGTSDVKDRLFVHICNFVNEEKGKVKVGARVEFRIGDPFEIGKKPQATHAKLLPEIETGNVLAGINALAAPQSSEVRS